MKKILIVSPHYPPSNLAAVHRTRLFAQHLPSFGWEPIVLTVDEAFYEEKPDHNLAKLLPVGQRVEKVKAFRVTTPRLLGDIGLRGFFQLYRKAKQIIKAENIDFVFIPIPSFYGALLGRWLYASTGIKYGIDYIDPWVHQFPGSDKVLSRHWFTTKIAGFLEPIAVKKAALITGVAAGYYEGVIDRNPNLKSSCIFGAMPYGGEQEDHRKVAELGLEPYAFSPGGKFKLVYAGALLPKAFSLLSAVFSEIAKNRPHFDDIEFHFIGTGTRSNGELRFAIKDLAEQFGLWHSVVFEHPERIPYLDVLIHLDTADAMFILGSTEPHYTPSKTYQGVLSGKPILAVLHEDSSAVAVIKNTNAGLVFPIKGEGGGAQIEEGLVAFFERFMAFAAGFDSIRVDFTSFEEYSAKEVTRKLVGLLEEVVKRE